jgi:hypothetical protein
MGALADNEFISQQKEAFEVFRKEAESIQDI